MKPPYAQASGTALAVVAAAGAVWLSAFFVSGVREQPIPLLPAIGSAAEKVVAASEIHTTKPKAAPVSHGTTARTVFVPAPVTPVASVRHAARPQHHAVRNPHRAPVHVRRRVATSKHFTAAPTPAPVQSSAAPRGRAVGWHRKHDQAASAPAAAPERRHGKSHAEHQVAAPSAVSNGNGNGNGNGKHQDHEQGNGGKGHDPGGKQ